MAYAYAHIIPVRYTGNATIPKTNRKKKQQKKAKKKKAIDPSRTE